MAAGQFIAHRYFSQFGDLNLNALDHAGSKLVPAIPGKCFHTHHPSAFAMRHAQGSVFDFFGVFTKNCAQKPLLRRQICLAFGRYLAHQNIISAHLGANAHHAVLVQIFKLVLPHIRNVVGGDFRTELGVAHVHGKIFNMNRSKAIVSHQSFGKNNRVFKVIADKRKKRHHQILP